MLLKDAAAVDNIEGERDGFARAATATVEDVAGASER